MTKNILIIILLFFFISSLFSFSKIEFNKLKSKYEYLNRTSPDIQIFKTFRVNSKKLISDLMYLFKISDNTNSSKINLKFDQLSKTLNDWDTTLKRFLKKVSSLKLSITRDLENEKQFSRKFPFLIKNNNFLEKKKRFFDALHNLQYIFKNKNYEKLNDSTKKYFTEKNRLFMAYLKTQKLILRLRKRLSDSIKKSNSLPQKEKKIASALSQKISNEIKQGMFKSAQDDLMKLEKLLLANWKSSKSRISMNTSKMLRARLNRLLSFMIRATDNPVKNYYQQALSLLNSAKDDNILKSSIPQIKDYMKKALKELLSGSDRAHLNELQNVIYDYEKELNYFSNNLSPEKKATLKLYKASISEVKSLVKRGDKNAFKKFEFLQKIREKFLKDNKEKIDIHSLILHFSNVKRLYEESSLSDKEAEFINKLLDNVSILIRKGKLSEASFILKNIEKKFSK